MRVVYFGTYSMGEGYPRNRVLIEGLRRAGVEVREVHYDFWEDAAHKIAGATAGAGRIPLALGYARAWLALASRYLAAGPHEAVVVGYTGQLDVFLARSLAALTGRPVVLDAFLSLHDTLVADRGLVREGGPFAAFLRWLDRTSSRLSDLVLLDTDAHIRLFTRETRLPARRFASLFVGEDDRTFRPELAAPRSPGEPLRVLWFGTFVPLQGVGTVLDAAAALAEDRIELRLLGSGQGLPDHRARAEAMPNVTLVPRWLKYDELVPEIRRSHVCLGIFGTGDKAGRVIPCKVYDALAVGRPVVTADTPAARELLRDGRDALLVPAGDGGALADALRRLAADDDRRRAFARAGHETFLREASPDALGARFRRLLETLQARRRA